MQLIEIIIQSGNYNVLVLKGTKITDKIKFKLIVRMEINVNINDFLLELY